ncbi:MAG: hypothetical protein OEW30_02600 [Acidimicrobiia bacterium]|nr:hypothetical protein [Acidimicrobiia bacterium]
MEASTELITADGVVLAARLDGPPTPAVTVVWCHPHPLYGGSMFAPLMNGVTDALSDRGIGVLRFNFRGGPDSGGVHGGGVDEVADVAAAVELAERRSPRVIVAGWSFGGSMALAHVAGDDKDYLAVAPYLPLAPHPEQMTSRTGVIVAASRDQVVDHDGVADYAQHAHARFVTIDSDHFFVSKATQVADAFSPLLA